MTSAARRSPVFSLAVPVEAAVGLTLILAVSLVAGGLGSLESTIFGRAVVEPLVIAMIAGMTVRAAHDVHPRTQPLIRFFSKEVLEAAVFLLGASMDVPRLFASGPALALGIATLVCVALGCGYVVGRAVGLTPKLATLVACGNAICGNSAIAAVAPVIAADREDIAASISLTAVLGIGVVLLLPLLIPMLGLSYYQYGVLAGLTVYAVPQVLAASFAVSALSGQVATAVKLARVLMLGPVVAFFALRGRPKDAPSISLRALVPWFVIGFVVLAALRSTGVITDRVGDAAKLVAGWLTVVAMAALGLSVDVRSIRHVGGRVVVAVVGSLAMLLVLAVALIRAIGIR
jgi:uncharacterized integral membrane protein (TIGR00698 family)